MYIDKSQKALTLVELLISIVLFGIISGAIMMTMSGSLRTTLVSRNVGEMTQSINNIFETIRRDLEMAGTHTMGGITVPNNDGAKVIYGGFDGQHCRNDIPDDIEVRNINDEVIGVIPAGTDTIAFTLTRPARDFGLIGCDSGTLVDFIDLTENYINNVGASTLKVTGTDQWQCYFNRVNSSDTYIYALIIDRNQGMLGEMFAISGIRPNEVHIANNEFSRGYLYHSFQADSRLYLMGSNPNAGKIEYFIIEWDEDNNKDPDMPLRSLVKRINNRDIYTVADNITNMQITYFLDDNTSSEAFTGGIPSSIEIELTIRSDDMIIGTPGMAEDIDPVTRTNTARYFETSFSTLVSIKGTVYKPSFDVRYYP